MKTYEKAGLKVRVGLKAGSLNPNHSRTPLRVRAGVKAGSLNPNHSRGSLKVKTHVRAGFQTLSNNHSRAQLLAC
jgi:hypothetical protein